MKHSRHLALTALVGATLLALVACGGGGGGAPSAASTLVGTAATGAAAASANVIVRDRSGAPSVCVNEPPVVTNERGVYTCTLSAQSQAPFVVAVTDPAALTDPMVSIVANKPAPGATGIANVTPLTTAIAAQMDALDLVDQPAGLAALNLADLQTVTSRLVAQLASVLASVGADPTTFDPLGTPIDGGSGTGTDALLDQVKVSYASDGKPLLANVLNPAVPAVPMAGLGSSTPSTVTTSVLVSSNGTTTASFAFSELDHFKVELERCFAVTAPSRAPNPDTAKRRLVLLSSDCKNFIARVGDAPNVDVDFMQSGYNLEAYFYGLFTDASMDGARFNRPEVIGVAIKDDGRHEALVNLKFVRSNGVAGNRILVARKFPGSRPDASSQWWLVGNQHPLDAFVRVAVIQREQTVPQEILDSPQPFFDTFSSRVEVGLQIYVQRPNNGSTVNNPNNPNNAVRYVRVRGPGLPPAGIVMADVAASDGRSSMSFLNATGSNPNASTSTQQFAANGGDIFRLQRTRGLGATAVVRTNPGASLGSIDSMNWAHPLMYGQSPSSEWQAPVAEVVSMSAYTLDAYCGSLSIPCHTYTTRVIGNLPSATMAARQPWNGLTAASLATVSAGAPATNALNVAWTAASGAERVTSVYAQGYNTSLFVDGSASVPAGANSQSITANLGGVYPAISISDNQTSRAIRLQYGVLDGSYKEHWIQFN